MSIKEHELWQLMLQKIKQEDESISSRLEESIWKICEYGIDLSKTIRDTFQTYTLHDETHICNVMTKMLEILGDYKTDLTKDECALLVMAACCHDIGMSASEDEKAYLRDCPDCMQTYLDQNPKDYSIAYQNGSNEKADITDEILRHYIRANHHKRVGEQLQDIEWPEIIGRFISVGELIAVCQSHGEDAETISRLNNFTPSLDLHLCAVLLRLGDILDFDATRAPDSIFRYINLAQLEGMENEKSRMEWKKHQASRGFILIQDEQRTLHYRAECTSIQVEQAIITYLNWVDDELNVCGKLIRYMDLRWRSIVIPGKVERQITAKGYLSGEYKITLDQDRVLDLLVGRELYSDPAVFVRELIQNAIDAVRTRKEMDKDLPRNWKPQINIRTWVDDAGFYWFRIEDNGIGMTEKSIQNFFLKVGHSYYNSDQFQADKIRCGVNLDYKPISRFGIGVLSCFMGDPQNNRVEVTTKHFRENGTRYPAYRLSIQGINGYYYLANDNDHRKMAPAMPNNPKSGQSFITEPGTIIAVRTNLYQSGGAKSFKDIVDKYVIYPEIPIHYEGIEGTCDYKTKQEFMDAIHEINPESKEGVYKPIERIPMQEDDFKELQRRYPEVIWEEQPSIAVYCLPLDDFADDHMVNGAVVIAKAEGKGSWRASKLEEKYVPKVLLETEIDHWYNSIDIAVKFSLDSNASMDLNECILPVIQSQLKEQNIEIDISENDYERDRFISGLSFQNLDDIVSEKFRVYQAIHLGNRNEPHRKLMKFEQFSWYQCWFGNHIKPQYRFEAHVSVNAHNGIFAGDSQIFTFAEFFATDTLLMLQDKYCPRLDISRNRIENLPLDAICSLDAIAHKIQSSLGMYIDDIRELRHYCSYNEIHMRNSTIPVKDYWKVLEQNPHLSSNLHFSTAMGYLTLFEIEDSLKSKDVIEVFLEDEGAEYFCWAVLMKYFELRIDFLNEKFICVYVVKKTDLSLTEELSGFPPSLLLPPIVDKANALAIIDGDYTVGPLYNAKHPFAKWLITNQIVLQSTVPGIYNQIVGQLRSGKNIIENINSIISQLRQIPHIGIEIAAELTIDDFIIRQK
ncbi:MAG: ATP-binding protein [Acetatifactor sp.]|nr:ATP-binding protein [Acetatifactor sp.]